MKPRTRPNRNNSLTKDTHVNPRKEENIKVGQDKCLEVQEILIVNEARVVS